MLFLPHVQPDVVAVSLEPVDLASLEDDRFLVGTYRKSRCPSCSRLRRNAGKFVFPELAKHGSETPLRLAGVRRLEAFPDLSECFVKPPVVEGLQEVIGRVDVESVERMRVKRSHENDRRHRVDADLVDHSESVELRHLDVEKYDVGLMLTDTLDSFEPVRAFIDDRNSAILLERDLQ